MFVWRTSDPGVCSERARAYIGTFEKCAEGLLRILNDILDFSRMEAGKLAFKRIGFSLSTLLAETHQIMLPQAIAKGLVLECQSAPEVPDLVLGDPARLGQVLVNLLVKAGIDFRRVRISPWLSAKPWS